MGYIESLSVLLWFIGAMGFVFGVVYPAAMVIWYRLSGSKLSVREILRRI